MIKFDIITIFPEIFDSYLKESIISRAQKKRLIKIKTHNLRKWASGPHQVVDDRPFGGGGGMVIKIEPIFKAVTALKKSKIQMSDVKFHPPKLCKTKTTADKNPKSKCQKQSKVILFTPRGKKFNQKMAYKFSKLDQLIMICGRYEGVDDRVTKYIADEAVSIGDYDLMGGELPAMIVVETTARLIPGVIGKPELLGQRITKSKGFIEYPQYTRPEAFQPKKGIRWRAPKILLSGHHKKIEQWREKRKKIIE